MDWTEIACPCVLAFAAFLIISTQLKIAREIDKREGGGKR